MTSVLLGVGMIFKNKLLCSMCIIFRGSILLDHLTCWATQHQHRQEVYC